MYGAVGSLVLVGLGSDNLRSFPSGAFGFNCVMTLSKSFTYTCALANQAIPSGVGKLVPAICRG